MINPLDLAKAAPWKSVLFTTYALSLSFFEAVVIDALIRGGGRNPTILSDPEGVRAGLSELGARLVGRDYELLPVERNGGVFHPKLSVFLNDDDAHILVGSGNLTFGGWGGNFEQVEHLHPSFAPEAIIDAAEFFELLQIDERIRLPRTESLQKVAEGLRRAAQGKAGSGRIRLIHNSAGTISERLRQEADDLGGAERICFVSPFFDLNGTGVTRLSKLLNCEDVSGYVHHAGSVNGFAGSNWPALSEEIMASVEIDREFVDDRRLLHAKSIEILCRKGRLILSGSANATSAALFGANMEAGVLRIEPDRQGAWSLSACPAPMRGSAEQDELDAEDRRKQILSAELVGTTVQGSVLTAWTLGAAKMVCEIEGDQIELGIVTVDSQGRFSQDAEQLADRIWSRGRVVIRLEAEEEIAEGFLMISAVAELLRRAGPAASRVLSVLAGTETPEDVAAIMAWFHEDPSRMPRTLLKAKGPRGDGHEAVDTVVTAAMLDRAHFFEHDIGDSGERSAGWQSAMSALLKAFRSNRGPFRSEAMASDDTGDSLTSEETSDLTRDEKHNERAIDSFSKLLDAALNDEHHGRYAETMMGIAHYLVDRIRPPNDRVAIWLEKIMRGLPETVEGDLAEDVLALQLMGVAHSPTSAEALKARRLLRRKGLLAGLSATDVDRLPAFHAYLPSAVDLEQAKELLCNIRTHREELQALFDTPPGEKLPTLLLLEANHHWPELLRVQRDPALRERIQFVDKPVASCPKCYLGLPTGDAQELLLYGLTRCTNKCRRLIISTEP